MSFDSFRTKLRVRTCDALSVSKTFTIGEEKTETQNVWAATRNGADGETIELWISRGSPDDVYDLAICLRRSIFQTVRNEDTLVLAAMFSDRELLKRVSHNTKLNDSSSMARGSSTFQGSMFLSQLFLVITVLTCSLLWVTLKEAIGGSNVTNNATSRSGHVQSLNDIKNCVRLAIPLCGAKTGRGKNTISSLNDCCYPVDHLERREDIKHIGIHADTKDMLGFNAFMETKRESLERFVGIITPLAAVFNLEAHHGSLHVFFDRPVDPIAFNRGGNIYLNLTYFEEWHDGEVKNGKIEQAQIFWFFALAHEIAHNLVEDHNSDHEFWFAAICAEHVGAFSKLRKESQTGTWQFFRR